MLRGSNFLIFLPMSSGIFFLSVSMNVTPLDLFNYLLMSWTTIIQVGVNLFELIDLGCVERLVICNTPSWFFSIWSVVARFLFIFPTYHFRVLPESIKKKIVTIDEVSKLDEYIDPKMASNPRYWSLIYVATS